MKTINVQFISGLTKVLCILMLCYVTCILCYVMCIVCCYVYIMLCSVILTLLLHSGPKIRLITIIGCLDLLIVAMLFFGLTMGANALGVDLFIFLTISGTMELPASSLLVPFVHWLGRKKSTMSCYFFTAVVLLAQPFISDGVLLWSSGELNVL